MMIIPADFASPTQVPANKLADAILACQRELQTGLMEVEFSGQGDETLLFVRGQLAAVYRTGQVVERLDPAGWLENLDESRRVGYMRCLALTPQDIRIFKILIEQQNEIGVTMKGEAGLDEVLSELTAGDSPVLAQVRWPKATALALFPGEGLAPQYSLLITVEQMRHSRGDLKMILAWPEKFAELRLYNSTRRSLAWTEFLLYQAFSGLVGSLLGKVDKLIGRLMLNQIIRDVNFKATAHDWNLSLNTQGVDDQTIFASPQAAAEAYSRLLEVIFQHFETVLGSVMLEMLVGETLHKLPGPSRQVLGEYMPITNLSR